MGHLEETLWVYWQRKMGQKEWYRNRWLGEKKREKRDDEENKEDSKTRKMCLYQEQESVVKSLFWETKQTESNSRSHSLITNCIHFLEICLPFFIWNTKETISWQNLDQEGFRDPKKRFNFTEKVKMSAGPPQKIRRITLTMIRLFLQRIIFT